MNELTRREVIGAAFALAAIPAIVRADDDEGRSIGDPHKDPRILVPSDVDAPMWPLVQKINRSGWVWTMESCWGHGPNWPVRLGFVTDEIGRLLGLLSEAAIRVDSRGRVEGKDPGGPRLTVWYFVHPKIPALGRYQIRVSHEATDARGRQLMTLLADKI